MRRYPIGAEFFDNGVQFRIWSPKKESVHVFIENLGSYPLENEGNGYFSRLIENVPSNSLYYFLLDQDEKKYPDPASRFQPQGPHGPSQVIDPLQFKWSDTEWRGVTDKSKVILYELHIGTFTQEGTWRAASEKLPYLAELGINTIEMMPIADFCGPFNWGYDGVNFFAPAHHYGKPDDLKAFIDQAHLAGIAVILDVVYNHFGPEGNYLDAFSEYYINKEETEWGRSINFDGPESENVRSYFITNAGYWIEEFHFDGLRLDACHAIIDTSARHVLIEIREEIAKKGGERQTYVIGENEQQAIKLVLPIDQGGYGLDGIWNEDFHHMAYVKLTGRKEAYYTDYLGSPQEFISSIKYGFLYQGQWYSWQKQRRGSPCLRVPHSTFINFLENHDQVANSCNSKRLRTLSHPGTYRALSTLFLLAPQIPLIFQGQEFGSTAPFYYFGDMGGEVAQKVFHGRIEFLSQFKSYTHPSIQSKVPPPQDERTFKASKLNWEEKESDPSIYNLYKELIDMRRHDPVFANLLRDGVDGAVLGQDLFLLRFFAGRNERLLLINLGHDLFLDPSPEPLLAPPLGCEWEPFWSSEEGKFGGCGNVKIPTIGNWIISGYSAQILYPRECKDGR